MNWTAIEPSSPLLPRPSSFMAIYYDSNDRIIHLLGGKQSPRRWIEYNITNNTFTDHGNQSLEIGTPTNLQCPQFYTQIDEYIFWIKDDVNLVRTEYSKFGRSNSEIVVASFDQRYPWKICVTSSHSHVFVIGSDWSFIIFDPNTNEFKTGPRPKEKRQNSGCAYDNVRDEVYAVAGDEIKSNERISMRNISATEWESVDDLEFKVSRMQAFYNQYDDSVVVVGGYRKEIQVIDCETGNVSVDAYLSYAVSQYGSIWVDSVLYVFGGIIDGGEITDKWQIMEGRLNTDDPTSEPTSPPSQPSIAPTTNAPSNPTKQPTFNPTKNPTLNPTKEPIFNPTKQPTFDPTKNPTLNPTKEPTFVPTEDPTENPTTHQPTKDNEANNGGSDGQQIFGLPLLTVIVIIGLILICTFLVFVSCMVWRAITQIKKKNANEQNTDNKRVSNEVDLENMPQDANDNKMVSIDYNNDDMNKGPGYANSDDNELKEVELEGKKQKPAIINGMIQQISAQISNADSMYEEVEEESVIEGKTKGTTRLDEIKEGDYDNAYVLGEIKEIESWLLSINMMQYHENFVLNGYKSMQSIKEIKGEDDLEKIKIVNKEHQKLIMTEISKFTKYH